MTNAINDMKRSPLRNYIVPGLTSSLLGGEDKGVVRMFEMSREQLSDITPHSHRFDFECLVLEGTVINRVWAPNDKGDVYQRSQLKYKGEPGKYDLERADYDRYAYTAKVYGKGDWYGMHAEQMHSITFSVGAKVLFFEGPPVVASTYILEPFVDGVIVPTFEVKPWMFAT